MVCYYFCSQLTILLVVATLLLCMTVHGQKVNARGKGAVKDIFPSSTDLTSTINYQSLDEYNENIKNVFGIFTSSTTSTSTDTNEKTEIIDEGNQESLQQTECFTNSDTCTPYYSCDNNTMDTTDSEPAYIDIRFVLSINVGCFSKIL